METSIFPWFSQDVFHVSQDFPWFFLWFSMGFPMISYVPHNHQVLRSAVALQCGFHRNRTLGDPAESNNNPSIHICIYLYIFRLFPTCQVRVVRFYVNSRASSFSSFSFSASPPPPRTSTTTSHAQCSLPDLNHDQPRPVFAAGPQPRLATPSVRCRTSTTTSHAQCSLPDLNHDHPRPVFAAGPQPRPSTPSVRCRTSTTTIQAQCSLPDLNRQKICQIECQKIWQIECQKIWQIEYQKIWQTECQKIYRQNGTRYGR